MTLRQNIRKVVKMMMALFITARSLGALAAIAIGAKTVAKHVSICEPPALGSGGDTKQEHHATMTVKMSGMSVQ